MSPDPLANLGALRLYAYCPNPINWIDPLGLDPGDEDSLFRGTSQGYAGSPGTQAVGVTPTSSDPAKATVFATEGDNFGNGVMHIATPQDLDGVTPSGPIGYRTELESEVGLNIRPAEFAERASITITSQEARDILRDMGIHVPNQIHDVPHSTATLEALHAKGDMTPEQRAEFVKKAREKAAERAGCGSG